MSTVLGVPTPSDFPPTAGNLDKRVTRNPDGTADAPWKFARRNGHLFGAENPWCPEHEYDAIASAHAMIDEHDQRIRDASLLADLDPYRRISLWWSYYNLSTKQFCADDANFNAGKPLQLNFSADGIAPYPPQRLEDLRVERSLQRIKSADEHALDTIIAYYGATRTAADISAKLATNPFAARIVQAYIDAQLPAAMPIETDPRTIPGAVTVTGAAPPVVLGPVSDCILRDPSLPPSLSNCLSADEVLALRARQAQAIESMAPEYYRTDEQAAATQDYQLRAYYYWKENFPAVRLVPAQNPGLRPAELTTPWPGPGLAPLVMVQITPRQRPLPEKSWLSENSWLGLVVSAIPFVGGIIAAGLSFETNAELKKWAGAWKPNNSEFAPQFYPKPFQVPLPLDRAQIAVRQPWYVVALVDQFAEEVRVNNLRYASEQYAALVNHYQTTSSGATPAQGAAKLGTPLPTTNAHGGALPILLALGLLVAGAPVAVPIAIVVLAGKKK